MTTHRRLSIAALVIAALGATPALAQSNAQQREASEHFKRATSLFDDKRYGDALEEFEKAYAAVPAFAVLYNLGQVHVLLGHPVEAVEAFEKYLAQGAGAIPAERRAAVEKELDAQRGRIGAVTITAEPAGTELRLDGKVVGKAPLASAVRAPTGRHTVEGLLDGYRSDRKEVVVAARGSAETTLHLEKLVTAAAPGSAPSSLAAAPPAPEQAPSDSAARTVGWVLVGVGGTAMGVGAYLALHGSGRETDASAKLEGVDAATYAKIRSDEYDPAHNEKTSGLIVLGIGGAIAAGGIALELLLPHAPANAGLRAAPWATADGRGLAFTGSF